MSGPPLPRLPQIPAGMNRLTPLWRVVTVCKAHGITYRQADNWIRAGAPSLTFEAQGSGSLRLMTLDEAVAIARVAQLRQHGIHLNLIADELYDRLLPDVWAETAVDALPGPDAYVYELLDEARRG